MSKCPNCNNTEVTYEEKIINFIDVDNKIAEPKYGTVVKCDKCGFEWKGGAGRN